MLKLMILKCNCTRNGVITEIEKPNYMEDSLY